MPDNPLTGVRAASQVEDAARVGAPALFGKLPAHGDFVTRGLEPRMRDEIDRWLSDAMTQARAAHGDAFDEFYERAAPWRFAFPRGDSWAAGALALSADAAGRRFPLYAERLVSRERVGAAADAVEAALYRAIVEGLAADAAFAAITDSDVRDDEAPVPAGWRDGMNAMVEDDPRPINVVARILAGGGGWE